jgi:hypothetical protein
MVTPGVQTTASVTWINTNSSFETPPKTIASSSISPDRPSYLRIRPPRGSEAEKWHFSNNTDLMMSLFASQGSIVDISFDYVLSDSATSAAQLAGPTISGGTNGLVAHKTISGSTGTLVISVPLNGN